MRKIIALIGVLTLVFSASFGQTYFPGKIIRASTAAAGSVQKQILDPNEDGFVSVNNTTGWAQGGDDTSASVSEIWYTPVKAYGGEPCCDLRRGADHKFSDFVPDSKKNGVYLNWKTGTTAATTYLRIRMRMGTIIPGSKGFSLLIDTDGKFGNTGSNSDPNYVAKTTGINGNPGFELELVLETGFRVAIYNIDGLGNPTDHIDQQAMTASPGNTLAFYDTDWKGRSQVSMAATNENGDPDYFIDWYVTLDELNHMKNSAGNLLVTGVNLNGTGQTFHIIPTTVMAPKPSTAGPISDMYGYSDSTKDVQPRTCFSCDWDSVCTAAPVITTTTYTDATHQTIAGTWAPLPNGSATATIYLYANGSATHFATATPASNGTWTITGDFSAAIGTSAVITAKAKGSGKESSSCFTSNSKKITSCITRKSPLIITNITSKGVSGTGYTYSSSNRIKVYQTLSTGLTFIGTDAVPVDSITIANNDNSHYSYTNGSASGAWQFSGSSTGGGPSAKMNPGSYLVIDSNTVTGCTNGVTFYCASFSSSSDKTAIGAETQQPTITSPSTGITTSTTSVSGGFKASGTAPSVIRIYVDSVLVGSVTPSGSPLTWSYTFPSTIALKSGDVVRVRAIAAATLASGTTTYYCASDTSATIAAIPACSTTTPTLNTDTSTVAYNQLLPGSFLSGTGRAGDAISVYRSIQASNGTRTNTLINSTTIKSSGAWSLADSVKIMPEISQTPAPTAIRYYVVAQKSTGCTATSDTISVKTGINTDGTFCQGTLSYSYTYPTGSYKAGQTVSLTVFNGTTPASATDTLYSDATNIGGVLSGTAPGVNTIVRVYVDNVLLSSATIAGGSTWSVSFPSGSLYSGAIVTIGVSQSGKTEFLCASLKVVCACSLDKAPAPPVISTSKSTLTNLTSNTPAIIKVTAPVSGDYYSVSNHTTGASLSKGYLYSGTGNQSVTGRVGKTFGNARIEAIDTLTITTVNITESQTADIKATRVGGTDACTSIQQTNITLQTLPVTLIEFKGSKGEKKNFLSWKTATEIDFSHFELERSTNAIDFSRLVRIDAKGQAASYSYSDANLTTATNYYRLKMVDIDGRFKYSNIVVIEDNGNSFVLNTIRPNPFVNDLRISLSLQKEQQVTMILVDGAGRQIKMKGVAGTKGYNEISLTGLNGLAKGFYTLCIYADGNIYQEKLVK